MSVQIKRSPKIFAASPVPQNESECILTKSCPTQWVGMSASWQSADAWQPPQGRSSASPKMVPATIWPPAVSLLHLYTCWCACASLQCASLHLPIVHLELQTVLDQAVTKLEVRGCIQSCKSSVYYKQLFVASQIQIQAVTKLQIAKLQILCLFVKYNCSSPPSSLFIFTLS